jgi:hypothetical protein
LDAEILISTHRYQMKYNGEMFMNYKLILCAALLFCLVQIASSNGRLDTTITTTGGHQRTPRIYNATRWTGTKPVIDGILNDSCWQAGQWAGNFTQWIPREGAKPSQPTQLKVLYDDYNIYVAIRAFDSEPEKIIRKGGRRDEFNGDAVGVCFDSYFDHRTGFEFDITAAGQKADLILTNPSNGDANWDAVWYAKVGMEDSAWVGEFEIPLSQLRYSSDEDQIWGMHCWRWIDRLQEESDWEPQSSVGPGMLYLFGELHGIHGLPKSNRFEFLPYTLGKLKTFQKEPGNPFADKGRTWLGNAGIDAKIGITSNVTADLTINPDFGQVESDPSVMNISAFETYYDEKRPFFLEGKNIFSFDFDNVNLFYSRRIGHAPTYIPDVPGGEFMEYPDNTAILGALKVSGKTSDGLAIGLLQSVTGKAIATLQGSGAGKEIAVEPLTSYSIARIQQDFNQSNTVLGGIVTATNRVINDAHLDFLNRSAFTGGIDLLHQWNDKEFYITAKMVGSTINGSEDAMRGLQLSSARYYQRPDQGYIQLDTTRTRLSGYGGQVKIGKGSKGLWRYSTELDWRSPGLDLNDLGFMQIADVMKMINSVSYFVNQPISIFRTYSFGVNETSNWDFGMRYLSTVLGANVYLEFLNKWAFSTSLSYKPEALDPRLLRGGSAMLVPGLWSFNSFIRTDPSESLIFDCTYNVSSSAAGNSKYEYVQPEFSVMPLTTLKFSLSCSYASNVDNLQYVDTWSVNNTRQYILGRIEQQSLGLTFRIDCNITPELSVQYYGSPYASVGRYSQFKTVQNPRAADYQDRFILITPTLNGTVYDITNGAGSGYSFTNPDFAFSQFRSNLVFRWEYLPGSRMYLVWSHERTAFEQPGNGSVDSALRHLQGIVPTNIFLIKISYWFSV